MNAIEVLHSLLIGGLITEVIILRRRVPGLPRREPCEICGDPAIFVKISVDGDGPRNVRLCPDCFGESVAADIREMEDDE